MSRFTKIAISKAFIELLNQRPIDKITVKDIVDSCEINRNTFYYYYQDIYALLEEILQDEVEKILQTPALADSWQDGFLEAIHFALENRRAIFHVYHSSYREPLERYFYQIVGRALESFIRGRAQGLEVPESDIRILCDFYRYALVGIFLEWVESGMAGEPEPVVRRLGVLLEGNIRQALEHGAATPGACTYLPED
ncbi:MAG: TetR-like C-terminal domain-containing protein [Oscillospiraceae bacterium]|nr:TetR-like C-terminal domain-containing protein [Oscillospiraceae bacterium]